MKLQPDRHDTLHIQAHGPGWIQINGSRYTHSVRLSAAGQLASWPCTDWAALSAEHLAPLLDWRPELVLLGSGQRLQFAPPAVLRPLIEARIGIETMGTQAAARTFNILAGEGRRVAAALLIEPA